MGTCLGGHPNLIPSPLAGRSVSPAAWKGAHLALETQRLRCSVAVIAISVFRFVLSDSHDISMRGCGGNASAVLRGRKTTFKMVFRGGSGQNSSSAAS